VKANLAAVSVVLGLLAVFVAASMVVFLLDVPVALRAVSAPAVPPQAAAEIKRTIVRTMAMGLGFGLVYLYGAVVSIRFLLRGAKDA
jgi:hypothetical protein